MFFSYNWLKEYIKGIPLPEKLAELLKFHVFEVEELRKEGKSWILDISVLPNRADCLSHLGMAQEISAITGIKIHEQAFILKESKEKAEDFISVDVKTASCCRYTAKVINRVKVGASPKWIQKRLKFCGLNSVNNIVDILNYVMLETGQPLHAFDADKINGKKIVVRFAREGEEIITLDNQKIKIKPNVLIIADVEQPIAIAGIKGGKVAEISKKTKSIVIESANFNQEIVRTGSKELGLKTDASLRFEHGLDPNLTESAINRVAYLIQELARGKTAKGRVDIYPKKNIARRIKLSISHVKALLGVVISEKDMTDIFVRLGFKILKKKPFLVEVPTRRQDILIPEDLIEEVGRIYGLDKIPAAFPVSSLIPPKKNLNIFWQERVKDILKECGFNEAYNYSFISEKDVKLFGFENLIELENPISEEGKYLRPKLYPNLLKNIFNNQKNFKDIRLFELGKRFFYENRIKEERFLEGVITGDFYEIKGVVELFLQKLGIPSVQFIPGGNKTAALIAQGERIGGIDEVSQLLLEKLGIKGRISRFTVSFDALQKLCSEEHEYRPISKYPAAVRDLAVLVPRTTKVVELLNKINAVGGTLIRDIDLFDVYEGERVPEGEKSLAFHIVYQSEVKTLSSEEIDSLQSEIITVLEKNPNWQVRK